MKKVRHPEQKEIPRLREIWSECFPEDIDSGYFDFFMEQYFKPEHALVVEDAIIETMGYFFRGTHCGEDGVVRNFLYLYAAGTALSCRGQNNLADLVEGGMAYARKLGYAGMFVTAAEHLVFLYERYGFRRSADVYVYTAGQPEMTAESLSLTECPYTVFSSKRRQYLASLDCAFGWQPESELFLFKELNLSGRVLLAHWNGESYYVCCTQEPDRILIRETDAPEKILPILAGSVQAYLKGSGTVQFYQHEPSAVLQRTFIEETLYYGHYRLLEAYPGSEALSHAYLNLIAD